MFVWSQNATQIVWLVTLLFHWDVFRIINQIPSTSQALKYRRKNLVFSAVCQVIIQVVMFLSARYLINPLHSLMPTAIQRSVFDRPPKGKLLAIYYSQQPYVIKCLIHHNTVMTWCVLHLYCLHFRTPFIVSSSLYQFLFFFSWVSKQINLRLVEMKLEVKRIGKG